MDEIWKDVVGYEDLYKVSNLGNISGKDRICFNEGRNFEFHKKEKLLSQCDCSSGYKSVLLFNNGKRKLTLAHRIIAQAFIPNPEHKLYVNHIDGDKYNNIVSNLEWVTASENQLHAFKIGIKKPTNTNRFGSENTNSKPIYQYKMNGEFVKYFGSIIDASRETGINKSGISSCASFRYKNSHAGGFLWRYEKDKIINNN